MGWYQRRVHGENNKNASSESTTINLPPLVNKGQNIQSSSEIMLTMNIHNLNPQDAYKNKGVEYINQEDRKAVLNESYLVDYNDVESRDYIDTKNDVKLFYKNGNVKYIGEVEKRNLPDGQGIEYHENGTMKYKGFFKDGWIDGENCIIFDEKGRKKYDGSMLRGKKHNFGILYEKNGEEIYEGNFKDDAIHNKQCIIYNKDGSVLYVGGIDNGKFEGRGR